VADEFRRRGPWVTRFVIDGVPYGGDYPAGEDVRVAQFFAAFPDASRILELGSLEGGHTLALARHPAVSRVVGIEGRSANVERARFVQRRLGLANVEFLEGNLEATDLASVGSFDAVFCVGLLYHLPRPWELLRRLAAVSLRALVWTHYASRAEVTVEGYQGRWFRERGARDPLSGLSRRSFWPTRDELARMVAEAGLAPMEEVEENAVHPAGPCLTFVTGRTRRG
jgi:SAM-dependent methyltransferase